MIVGGMADLRHLDPLARRPDDSGASAIDRDHLRRMTLDDPTLEREVLVLFERQAVSLTASMRGLDAADLAACAHKLKGSACGVGAFAVARAAEAVELATTAQERTSALAKLSAAVADAKSLVGEILRAH